MDRRTFVALAGGAVLGLSPNRRAQGQVAVRRIGFLSGFPRADIEVFRSFLRPELEKLGWTDGRNILLLEPRVTGGDNARLPSLASELVADAPDLILVQTVPATRALMQATKSIPIVMVGVANPIELGIVSGFVKPGGNITGASFLGNEFASKLLQYVKAAAPRLRSVDLFVNPSNEAVAQFVKHMQADAVAIGMQIRVVEVASPGEFEPAFAAIRKANNGINTASTRTVNPIQTRRHCGLRAHSRNAAGCCGRQPCSSGKWVDGLWTSARRVRATRRALHRPDLEGRQTGRAFHRATDAVPSRDQSQDGQGARPDYPAEPAAERGRED